MQCPRIVWKHPSTTNCWICLSVLNFKKQPEKKFGDNERTYIIRKYSIKFTNCLIEVRFSKFYFAFRLRSVKIRGTKLFSLLFVRVVTVLATKQKNIYLNKVSPCPLQIQFRFFKNVQNLLVLVPEEQSDILRSSYGAQRKSRYSQVATYVQTLYLFFLLNV